MIFRAHNNLPGWLCLPFLVLLMAFLSMAGCKKQPHTEVYQRFPENVWIRFNILSFQIPVTTPARYDVILFTVFTPDFQFDTLSFNMFMRTSSGEERIRDYQVPVRSPAGTFLIECVKDTCTGTVMLKKDLNLTKAGILKIEIENLSSRMRTEGIRGIGIRLSPSGK
jgi:hypothetical protein